MGNPVKMVCPHEEYGTSPDSMTAELDSTSRPYGFDNEIIRSRSNSAETQTGSYENEISREGCSYATRNLDRRYRRIPG